MDVVDTVEMWPGVYMNSGFVLTAVLATERNDLESAMRVLSGGWDLMDILSGLPGISPGRRECGYSRPRSIITPF